MLIRIIDHFKDNPKRIDKLIAVKGLPDEWFWHETAEGKQLKRPWLPDIDKNIPFDIREFCEPTYILIKFPPLNNQTPGFIEKKQILGVRIDYNTEPGRQMWDDVERYIEESIPRGERLPVPVICSKDERSAFETFTVRRNTRGSLELVPSPVPMVDLTKYLPVKMTEPPIPAAADVIGIPAEPFVAEKEPVKAPEVETPKASEPEPESQPEPPAAAEQPQLFECSDCERTFLTQQGLKIHLARPKNHKKETIGV